MRVFGVVKVSFIQTFCIDSALAIQQDLILGGKYTSSS